MSEKNKTAQLSLFNGLSEEDGENVKRTRKRFELSDTTINKLSWLVERDAKKNKSGKRHHPHHTIERLIENEYYLRRNMQGEE